MNVFTYGTLTYPEVWTAVAGETAASVRGSVEGFAIYRIRDQVFPGILAATAEDLVPGVVYLDVGPEALRRLDQFEDDFYERRAVTVISDDGRQLEAEAYVVPPANRDVLTAEPWSADEFIARGDLDRFIERFAGFGRIANGAD
jgi:gamma-glutamylcyclotransferase (GGCT)/AIG2-like uncharacterized protein YtfP